MYDYCRKGKYYSSQKGNQKVIVANSLAISWCNYFVLSEKIYLYFLSKY